MIFKNFLTDSCRRNFVANTKTVKIPFTFGDESFEYNSIRKAVLALVYLQTPYHGHSEGTITGMIVRNENKKYNIIPFRDGADKVKVMGFETTPARIINDKRTQQTLTVYKTVLYKDNKQYSPAELIDLPDVPKKNFELVASTGKVGTVVLNSAMVNKIKSKLNESECREFQQKLANAAAEIIVSYMHKG